MKAEDLSVAIRTAQDESVQAHQLLKGAKQRWQAAKVQVREAKAFAKSAKKILKGARKQAQRVADKEQELRERAKKRAVRSAKLQRVSKAKSERLKSLDHPRIAGSPERSPSVDEKRRAAIERRERTSQPH